MKNKEKWVGISALVLSILAVFLPIMGLWLTVFVALLAMFAIGPGFKFGVAAIVINLINIFFFSPMTWIYLATVLVLPIFLIGVQIVAFIVLVKRNKKSTSHKTTSV